MRSFAAGGILADRKATLATLIGIGAVASAATSILLAAETTDYKYDARGRLVAVSHSGGLNNGTITNFTYDKSDNRLHVEVKKAP